MNVHFHVLALDGVYVRDESSDNPSGRICFHALCTPTRAEVAAVAGRTAARIEKILKKAGRSLDPEMQDAVPPERRGGSSGFPEKYRILLGSPARASFPAALPRLAQAGRGLLGSARAVFAASIVLGADYPTMRF